jgi:beta-glucosidase
LQGDSLSDSTSILACAKHYLGDGGTINGTDQGNTQLDETDIRKIHLPEYISAIDSGVGSVMISFSSINGQKMHGYKSWITDVLKNELGFKGFVVSD